MLVVLVKNLCHRLVFISDYRFKRGEISKKIDKFVADLQAKIDSRKPALYDNLDQAVEELTLAYKSFESASDKLKAFHQIGDLLFDYQFLSAADDFEEGFLYDIRSDQLSSEQLSLDEKIPIALKFQNSISNLSNSKYINSLPKLKALETEFQMKTSNLLYAKLQEQAINNGGITKKDIIPRELVNFFP